MKTELKKLFTKDNLELQGLIYEPDVSTNKVILHVHGMAGNFFENSFLDYMAKTYTAKGYTFVAFNNRGYGYISDLRIKGPKEKFKTIGEAYEKFEECVLDIEVWIDFLQKRGYSDIILQGHSLGCPKVVYYQATKKDKRIGALVLASPADMIGLVKKEKDYNEIISLAKKMKKNGKGRELMPKKVWNWYPITADTYINLFDESSKTAIFNLHKESPTILSDIDIPILTFFGSKDDAIVFNPEKDLGIIKRQAKGCPKIDTFVVEDALHSYYTHEQEVVDKIIEWVKGLN